MGHQAGQGYCLQSLDPTSMSEGLIFLPVHMASRDSQHFVISHPTAIIFFFMYQNTLRYIHMQWPHFWVKEGQRLGYPGLAFSWSTFCTIVPFLSSSLFYFLWFPSGLLLCPLIFFILMPECLSLSLSLLRQLFPINPHLFSFFFFKLFSYFKFPLPQSSVWISAFHLGHLIPSISGMKTKEGSCCCCSVLKSCPTLCNPMNCSTPGSLVLHYLSEFAQIYVHWVSDAI